MNESFHKNLSLLASPKSGKEGLHMKKMQVEIAIYRYNTRYKSLLWDKYLLTASQRAYFNGGLQGADA